MEKRFKKNDESFVCVNCGNKVEPLFYTSRDHCNRCLASLHIDINPGDRLNDCLGTLMPIDIENNSKKGYVIIYKCNKCAKIHKNKAADDDNLDAIISLMNKTYEVYIGKIFK